MHIRFKVSGLILILILSGIGSLASIPESGQIVDSAVADPDLQPRPGLDYIIVPSSYSEIFCNDDLSLDTTLFTVEDHYYNETKVSKKKNVIINPYCHVKPVSIVDSFRYGIRSANLFSIQKTFDDGYIAVGFRETTETCKRPPGTGGAPGPYISYDLWLVKTNKNLEEIWNQTFGDYHYDIGFSIKQTVDSGFIIAGYTTEFQGYPDGWLIKLDKYGFQQWNRTFGGDDNDIFYAVEPTTEGGYIATGYSYSYGKASAGGERTDTWLLKTDPYGNEEWNRTYYEPGFDSGYDVKQTSDGGYIISGDRLIKTFANGTEEWRGNIPTDTGVLKSVCQTSDGGFITAGNIKHQYPYYNRSILLLKVDENGDYEWSNSYNIRGDEWCNSLILTDYGDYLIAGGSSSNDCDGWDALLMLVNKKGIAVWERLNRKYDVNEANFVIKDAGGGYAVCGLTGYSTHTLNENGFILKVDHNGSVERDHELVSTDLFEYFINKPIDKPLVFNCTADIPNGSVVKIQFSYNTHTWYNRHGYEGSSYLQDGENIIHLDIPNHDHFFYKITLIMYKDFYPVVSYINISTYYYEPERVYTSEIFAIQSEIEWKSISWDVSNVTGTEVKFQLRTAPGFDSLLEEKFIGLEGTAQTYYTSSPSPIWKSIEPGNLIQYKVYLKGNAKSTPILNDVKIDFNYIPRAPVIHQYSDTKWHTEKHPKILWDWKDLDGYQSAYQILIDNDENFSSIMMDSGIIESKMTSWNFLNNSVVSTDGVWYYIIRIMDNEGEWSEYCKPAKIMIDTEPPLVFPVTTDTNHWTSSDPRIIFSTKDTVSGIDRYEIRINDNEFFEVTSPYSFRPAYNGSFIITVRAYDKAGNYEISERTIFVDKAYPKIQHSPVQHALVNENIKIRAQVKDYHSDVKYVYLFYRHIEDRPFTTLWMKQNGNEFTATIPSTFVTEDVEYFIEAADNSNPSNVIFYGRFGEDTEEPWKLNEIRVSKPVEAEMPVDETEFEDDLEPLEDPDVLPADYYEKPAGDEGDYNLLHGIIMLVISIIFFFIISFLWQRFLNRKVDVHGPTVLNINYTLPKNHVIFSPVINGLIMNYLKPENQPEFSYALVKKLHYFKPPPTMYETVTYTSLKKDRFTLLRVHCSGCNESSMVKLWRNSYKIHCPVCNTVIWKIN